TPRMAGVLSCLYADDELVAAHFGMRSGAVLHSWFPAYTPSLNRYSPGLVLLRMVLEAAPAHGVEVFDLGPGTESYKSRFANATLEVGAGWVAATRTSDLARRVSDRSWSAVLHSPLYRRAHRLRQRLGFR